MNFNFHSNWWLPHFYPIVKQKAAYKILKGSRNSAKSRQTAKALVYKCIHLPYFKCIHSMKVHRKIKEGTFATLMTVINSDPNFKKVFSANNTDYSITCRNGNKFVAKGMDKEDNPKGVESPTHAWMEELDQFTWEDFNGMDTTLRGQKGQEIELYGTFNPTVKNWIYDEFFVKNRPDAIVHESTFWDNPFIDREAYHEKLLRIKELDENLYNVWANGKWGVPDYSKLFLSNYRAEKVLIDEIPYDPNLPIQASFDFNVTNTCLVSQSNDNQIRRIKEYRAINQDLEELCSEILTTYNMRGFYLTGDASGGNRSALTRGTKTAFDILIKLLRIGEDQIFIHKSNPPIASSRLISNALIKTADYKISTNGCPELIKDIETAPWPQRDYEAWKTKNPERSHCFDAMRYDDYNLHIHKLDEYGIDMLSEKGML